ncbi:MAG: hypothetical protein KKA05_04595 [Alphaproteobacteria bacterium]|nr:hypothetical protein [Alphaproteobacteria bacterium]
MSLNKENEENQAINFLKGDLASKIFATCVVGTPIALATLGIVLGMTVFAPPTYTPLCGDSGIGQSSYSQVFNGAAEQKICTVDGTELQPDTNYIFEGGLIINGEVPANVSIVANNGKLIVNGNVNDSTELVAEVPVETSTYTTSSRIGMGPMHSTSTHTRFEGYTYESDTGPSLIINGDVQSGAFLFSNHGIHVTGKLGDKVNVRHSQHSHEYATVTTGPALKLKTTFGI